MRTASVFGLSRQERLDARFLSLPKMWATGVGTRYVTRTEGTPAKSHILNDWTLPLMSSAMVCFSEPHAKWLFDAAVLNTVTE